MWAKEELLKPRAAVRIQCTVRRHLATMVLRHLRNQFRAAGNLQRLWRGRVGRRRVAWLRAVDRRWHALVTLQCFFRVVLARRLLAFLKHRRYLVTVERPAAAMVGRFIRKSRARNRLRALVLRHIAAKRIQRWYRNVSCLLNLIRSGWKPFREQRAERVLAAFGRRVVARRRHRFAAAYKRGVRLTATAVLQRWWRGCICRFRVRPQMEVWRVEKVRRQLDAWRMLILSLQGNVKDVLTDIKVQVGAVGVWGLGLGGGWWRGGGLGPLTGVWWWWWWWRWWWWQLSSSLRVCAAHLEANPPVLWVTLSPWSPMAEQAPATQ